ncbi:unnamed protein product [Lactuca virosa]|nr:unnamed protein product [Lactuca virosa]
MQFAMIGVKEDGDAITKYLYPLVPKFINSTDSATETIHSRQSVSVGMARNQNHDDDDASTSSRKKRIKTRDNSGVGPWSELNHDVLFLVMMQLSFVDFVAFSGVCKSWRSFALRKRFMASRPPMLMSISDPSYMNSYYCHLKDFDGRKFKTLLPHSVGRRCVFVVIDRLYFNIWFSVEGKGAWNHVSSTYSILDLHAFKGKIYARSNTWRVYEMKLNPKPKLTLLKIKNFPKSKSANPVFVSSDENLYVMDHGLKEPIEELDFGEMKWVSPKEKTIGEYSFFCSDWKYGVVFNPELWIGPRSQLKRYDCFCRHTTTDQKCPKGSFFSTRMWYFPHSCLNVDIIDG